MGVGDGQGGQAYCGSWGRKELDTTERLILSDGNYETENVASPMTATRGPQLVAAAMNF